MTPLNEAKYKDIILKFLQPFRRDSVLDYGEVANIKELKGVSGATIAHLIDDLTLDCYVITSSSRGGKFVGYQSRADYFLEQGGYEAQYYAEKAIEEAEDKKYGRIERQKNFIRFVKVIKSGAWLVGFIVSIAFNIYFVLKFWLKWI